MSIEDEILAELKAVFQEELAQQRDALERQRLILLRETSTAQEQSGATREVYRIAHGLKGAARAVGATEVVRLAHETEEQLSGARRGEAVPLATSRGAVEALLVGLGGAPAEPAAAASATATVVSEEVSQGASTPPAAAVRVQTEGIQRVWAAVEELRALVADDVPDEGADDALGRLSGEFADLRRHLLRASPAAHDVADAVESLRAIEQGVAEARRRSRRAHEETQLRSARTRARLHALFGAVRALRAEPARTLLERLERNCLAVAQQCQKKVRFVAEGADLMLDRDVLEAATEALMHLVSNAVDHGIESPTERAASGKTEWGEVRCSVQLRGSNARFAVSDDGQGIDVDALRRAAEHWAESGEQGAADLVFLPGLSTAETTSTVSGRGMGLDFVRRCVHELGGEVQVEAREGGGTLFILLVPAEHGGFPALVAEEDGGRYVIPLSAVSRIVRRSAWSETDTPAARLGVLFEDKAEAVVGEGASVGVVLQARGRRGVVWVERVVARDHVVARPLSGRAEGLPMITAAVQATDGVVLPVLDCASVLARLHAQVACSPAESLPQRRRRVLVADDSITTRQLVRMILNKAGYDVVVAEDGEVAWARIREGRFDLVVSDLEMPRLSGLDLLRRVRERSVASMPFVLVTARDDEEARRRAEGLGVDAYVLKAEFDRTSLLETIEEVLAR